MKVMINTDTLSINNSIKSCRNKERIRYILRGCGPPEFRSLGSDAWLIFTHTADGRLASGD
jgi:hypothetical protein